MTQDEFKAIRRKISYYFQKKEFRDEDYSMSLRLVNKIKEYKPSLFEYYLGKILFLTKKYEQAEIHLKKALNYDSDFSSCILYLYKLSVMIGNYEQAHDCLLKYEELNKKVNVDLFISMIEQILDLRNNEIKEYNVEKNNLFGVHEIKDDYVLKKYNKINRLYNEKKYVEMEKEILYLKKYIEEMDYCIEVDTLNCLLHELIIEYDKFLYNYVDENTDINFIIENINKGNININKFLPLLDKILDKDYNKFNEIINNIEIDNNRLEIKYLKNKSNELEIYDKYNVDEKEKYDKYIELGSKLNEKKEYDEYISIYNEAYDITKNKVFLYYIGKVCYKCGYYKQSIEFLNKYIEQHGGIKLEKTLIYLSNAYNKLGIYKKSNSTFKMLQQLNLSFKRDIELYRLPVNKKVLKQELDFAKNSTVKQIYNHDFEFNEKSEELLIEKFDEYTLVQKLKIIKKLYELGNFGLAEKYLKQVESNKEYDRSIITQFQKNKTLYKNKRK